jgi:hypothetical protein
MKKQNRRMYVTSERDGRLSFWDHPRDGCSPVDLEWDLEERVVSNLKVKAVVSGDKVMSR